MSIRSLAFAAAAAAWIATGCMGWWLASVDADRPRRSLEDLRDREDEHAEACAGYGSLDDQGDEPDRYVDDVYYLTDDMVEACGELMRAGRVDQDDYDDVDEIRGRLRITVDEHRGRIEVVVDVDGLHTECAEHHVEMLELLDETEARLAAGGMMGGGMM